MKYADLKRLLALFMVLVMCFSMLPVTALAVGDEGEDFTVEEEAEDLASEMLKEQGGGDIGPCEHEPAEILVENEIAPTCTEPGSHDEVVYCAVCGEELSRETVEVPALGHSPEAVEAADSTCTVPGHNAGVKCAICGGTIEGCEELPLAEHVPTDVEEIPAASGVPGRKAGVICNVCGAVLEGCTEIPALEETAEDEADSVEADAEDDNYDEITVASTVRASGKCGTDGREPNWTLYDDGLLVIDGKGSIKGYSLGNSAPWKAYTVTRVQIGNEVTGIGARAFVGCTKIESVTFINPSSVTGIGSEAFYNCNKMTSINLPSSLTSIKESAFADCKSLPSVTIPDSVTSIGKSAFYYCSGLTQVTLSKNLTSINNTVFNYCTGLTSIDIPESVTSIGDSAFYYCKALTKIDIPESVTSIGQQAFNYCNALTHVYYDGTQAKWAEIEVGTSNTPLTSATLHCRKFTVSYDANGGTGAPSSQIKELNTALTLRSTKPARTNYGFLGWAKSKTATTAQYQPGASYTQNADVTLYAVWQEGRYTVSYDANGGMGAPEAQTKIHGTDLILNDAVPTREGYDFLGWATSKYATTAQYQPGASYTTEGDRTLYAVWQLKTYTVSYDANGGEGAPPAQTKTHGTALTLSNTVPTHEGYDFLGWATSADEAAAFQPRASYTVEGDAVLYAVWQLKTYTVSYNANGGEGAPPAQTKTHFEDLILSETVPSREGYNFLGWAIAADAVVASYQPGDTYTSEEALTLYAVWQLKTYTISYDANSGEGAPAAQTKNHFEDLILSETVPSREGYNFLGWAASADAPAATWQSGGEYAVEGDAVLYAVWQLKTYVISYDANGGEGAPPTQTKNHFEDLILSETVPSREGYNFLGWATAADAVAASYQPGDTYTSEEALALYAVWQLKTYTISYDANSGEGAPAAQTKNHFEDLILSETVPSREGYNFLGWAASADASAATWQSGGEYAVEGDAVLYAVWQLKTYAISYDANGGEGAPPTQTKNHFEELTLSDVAPTRTGYDFLGWARTSDASGAEFLPGASYTENADLTLYAVWEIKSYALSFDANGGNDAPATQTADYLSRIQLPTEIPTRTGYDFLGWAKTSSASSAQYQPGSWYTIEQDTTLYAVWSIKTYSITYNANGGSNAPSGQTKIYDAVISLSNVQPVRTGYDFLGWARTSDASGAEFQPGASYAENADLTLYAVWEIKSYTLSFHANGGTGAPSSLTAEYQSRIQLPTVVPTRTGYDFLGWAKTSSASSAQYQPGSWYTIEQDTTLYAVWKIWTYTITYSANGGSNAPSKQTKNYNATITLSSVRPVRTGYDFLGWARTSNASSAEFQPGAQYRENANLALYAVWKIKTYTLSFDANGGTNPPESQSAVYMTRLQIPSTIPQREGYNFTGWTQDADAVQAQYHSGDRITLDADICLYAVWSPYEYTIAFDANGGENAPDSQIKYYDIDLQLTSDEPTKENYGFLGWATSADATAAAYQPGSYYTAEGDATLYAVWAKRISKTGSCGSGLSWTLFEDGELLISGSGSMNDYSSTTVPWTSSKVTVVSISSGVTGIGNNAFSGCTNLTEFQVAEDNTALSSVDGILYSKDQKTVLCCPAGKSGNAAIAQGTTTIAPYAFAGCTGLTSIEIPSTVQTIGASAFRNCSNVTSVVLPEGISSIGSYTFYGCKSITEFVIPNGISSIGTYAFASCTALSKLTLPKSVKSIGNYAFSGCTGLTTVDYHGKQSDRSNISFGSGNTYLTNAAWEYDQINWNYNSSTKTLTISGKGNMDDYTSYNAPWWKAGYYSTTERIVVEPGITSIGNYAFDLFKQVKSVELPDSIERIGSYAFSSCEGLQSISLPADLKTLGDSAFRGCHSIQQIVIPDSITSLPDNVFWGCKSLRQITIPDTVSSIGSSCFRLCTSLQSITLPSGITEISDQTFYQCSNLRSIVIPSQVTVIGNEAFHSCSALTSVTLPAGLQTIDGGAFSRCGSLSSVSFPNGLKVISVYAFEACNLQSVFIPASVTEIGAGCFSSNKLLTQFTVDPSNNSFSTLDGVLFSHGYQKLILCPPGKSGTLYIPKETREIDDEAVWDCDKLSAFSVDADNATYSAFDGMLCTKDYGSLLLCPEGKSGTCTIPGLIKAVEEGAFAGSRITHLIVDYGVERIEYDAFIGCEQLIDVYLPRSLTYLDDPFTDCDALQVVYYGGSEDDWYDIDGDLYIDPDVELVFDFATQDDEIRTDREYLLMSLNGGSEKITAVKSKDGSPVYAFWTAENADKTQYNPVVHVDDFGNVYALRVGTASVIATYYSADGNVHRASCRVDVVRNDGSSTPVANAVQIEGISLPNKKAAVELFKTDYTSVMVVLNLRQNISVQSNPEIPQEPDDNGAAIQDAWFADSTVAGLFHLRVKDDRSLEIVPTAYALSTGEASPKSIKGSYSSQITIVIDGRVFTTNEKLTLSVKKSLPKLKATAIKLNSFYADTEAIRLTGGTVKSIALNTAKSNPAWIRLNASDFTVSYVGSSSAKSSGTLNLLAKLEGWAIKCPVSVKVNAAPVVPKLSFSPSTLTITPGNYDEARTTVTISPAEFANEEVRFSHITEGNVTYNSSDAPVCRYNSATKTLTVTAPKKLYDGSKARTFKLWLEIAGIKYAITLKTPPSSKLPKLSAKASGVIDTGIHGSPVTVTVSVANYHFYDNIEVLNVNSDEVTGKSSILFGISRARNGTETVLNGYDSIFQVKHLCNNGKLVFTISLKDGKSISASDDYYFYLGLNPVLGGSSNDIMDSVDSFTRVKIKVKNSDPSKYYPSVSLKTSGYIDVLRPDTTAVVIQPVFKNWYGYTLNYGDLHFYQLVDGAYQDAVDYFDFDIVDGKYVVVLDEEVNHTAKFYVRLETKLNGNLGSGFVPLNIKMGKSKITSDVKSIQLLKRDRYSYGTVIIKNTDDSHANVKQAFLDSKSDNLFDLVQIDPNTYQIHYNSNQVTTTKATTVKLNVYLEGNNSTKANATISVKVTFG